MYLEYFGFQEEPFNITPNSKFLFLSQRHREALAALLYGIEQRKGFIALTGHIGCGKTTICRAMLGKLDRSKTRLALVLNPEFNDVELLQTINGEFGLDAKSTSKRELLDTLNRFLLNEYKNDRNVVLLIDEAQRLPPDALEQVRLISNLETETAKLIQIALVGQPELADLLDLPELEQLNQRITVRYHIEPLSLDEVAEYVNHRIAIARRLNINNPVELVRFTKKALRKVYEYSGGVPRRVNVVSDRSLLVTFVREQKEVSEENVEKAIEELGGMPKRRRKSAPAHIRAAEDEFAESEQRIDGEIPVADSTEEDVPAPVAAATSDRRALNVLIILVVMGVVGYGLTKLAYPAEKSDSVLKALNAKAQSASASLREKPAATPVPEAKPTSIVVAAATTPAPTATVPAPTPSPEAATPAPSLPAQTAAPSAIPTMIAPTPEETPPAAIAGSPEPTLSTEPSPTVDEFVPVHMLPKHTGAATNDAAAPEPTEAAAATPAPENTGAATLSELMKSPTPTAAATPSADSWRYDENGIMRVSEPPMTYGAAVLTWLAVKRGDRMSENDLAALRTMKREQVAALQLTTGRAPLFLREGHLPASLSALAPSQLPILLQVDDATPGVGPWAVIVAMDDGNVTLLDPRAGRLILPKPVIADHVSAVIAPYFDPKAITGLKLGAKGDSVVELQRLLKLANAYANEPTGDYDAATAAAVAQARVHFALPAGGDGVDATLAARLIANGEGLK